MIPAKIVVISRGAWPSQNRHDGFEIMFDDFSDSPFCLHLSPESFDVIPGLRDNGKEFAFSVRIHRDEKPYKIMDIIAGYRSVNKIPHMKQWKRKE